MRTHASLTIYCLAAACVLLFFAWLGQVMRRARAQRRAKKRQTVAIAGERRAKQKLKAEGFRIVDEQVRAPLHLRLDGQLLRHEVRADLLVERQGMRFVAEVKTGTLAPSLAHGPTRRQLLEYSLVYDVAGALLVGAGNFR